MIGVTIGSGIYKSPAVIAQHTSSPAFMIAMWVVGGILSLFGALAFAELAAAFPRSGGLYNFLHAGFGPRVSFVFGWTYMLIVKPFAASGICIVFAEFLNQLLGTDWHKPTVVCVMLVALTWINTLGMNVGAGMSVLLTAIKYLCLIAIIVLALVLPGGEVSHFAAGAPIKVWWLALAPIMSQVLWTYDGWSDVGSVAGEVREPQKNLPRIYAMGTLAVIAIYVAVNAAYIYVLPLDAMRGLQGDKKSVVSAVLEALVGEKGTRIVTAMVLISTLGSTHASILTGARVTFAQAQDGLLFRFLGRIHPKHQTPAVALWVQCLMSCAAVLFLQSFQKLADGFVFTMWIFYAMGAAAVIVLRVKQPGLARPYRCWGYPVVPVLFVLAAVTMTGLSIQEAWKDTVPWIGVLLVGWPMYSVWRRFSPDRTVVEG